MMELLTAAQMRAIENAAIESGEATGLELMERAGRGVVEAIFEEWPDLAKAPRRAVVLCGPGNNGGDGFVAARLLNEWGWDADVFLHGDAGSLPPDAKANCARWQAMGKTHALSLPAPSGAQAAALGAAMESNAGQAGPAVVVDALFGTGLARPVEGLKPLLESIGIDSPADPALRPPRRVSVDVPSGICSDSGRIIGGDRAAAVGAHLTVSFHALKIGHVLADGPAYAGKAVLKSIGLEAFARRQARQGPRRHRGAGKPGAPPAHAVARQPKLEDLRLKVAKRQGHKYMHGHVLVLSGGVGKGGAARMAAAGALRIGAGLVTVGCPPSALQENAARLDAIMLRPIGSEKDLSALLGEDGRINAICLGPGFGTGKRERLLAAAALAARRPTVIDADALAMASDDASLFAAIHEHCVLTPHAGEFARIFPDAAGKLDGQASSGPAYSKLDAAREAAELAGCTVLFKGQDTVAASPDGGAAVNSAHCERAAPWLATAGAGDVLAGFVAGLLARGLEPLDAAETAAWLHVECALKFGPGVIAEDLPKMLPRVFRDMKA